MASQAIQAEVRLLHRERQRICPQQESLASTAGSEASVNLDFSRYFRCRQEAEAQLRQHHPVLYTNRHGLTLYTPDGARWARQAALSVRRSLRSAEQAIEVVAHHRLVLTTLLEQEAGQGRLHQPVLVPLGMLLNEPDHRFE